MVRVSHCLFLSAVSPRLISFPPLFLPPPLPSCNHPFLIDGAERHILASDAGTKSAAESLVYAAGKMVLLHKLLPKLRAEGHKVLIFSQMVMVLNILESYLRASSLPSQGVGGLIACVAPIGAADCPSNAPLPCHCGEPRCAAKA